MNVKILFFPLAITITLFLSIFYIKPEIDAALANNDIIEAKTKIADTAKMKASNVQTLESSLNGNKQAEALVLKYLPVTQEDDRIVDSVSFLTSQSGVILDSIKLAKATEVAPIEVIPETASSASTESLMNASAVAGDGTELEVKEVAAKSKEIVVDFSVRGSYEGIKDMINKLSKMDRFQNFSSINIERVQSAEASAGDLEATIAMSVSYLPKVKSQGKFNRDILDKTTFSFDTVKVLQNQISSAVPAIEVGAAGASNPFVR